MKAILQVENLSHTYRAGGRDLKVLLNINLEIGASSMTVVQGASGCGKTSLLLACGGMQKPTVGVVQLKQRNLFEMGSSELGRIRAHEIGYLFQTLELLPYLNVLDNVRIAKGVSAETAKRWLVQLGLQDRLTHKPDSISHGERQRTALARAIAHGPALIVADEPTGNLDPANSKLVFETLRQFADDGGAVLIASHHSSIESYADQVFSLESGSLAELHLSS